MPAPDEVTERFAALDPNEKHHRVRVADLAARRVQTLALRGLEPPRAAVPSPKPATRLEPVIVGPGRVEITLDVRLPPGTKPNGDAPWMLRDGGGVTTFPAGQPPTLTVAAREDAKISFDLTIFYCTTEDAALCLLHDARLVLPVHVAASGPQTARVAYAVPAGD
jgi:hypothetical protein